MVQLNPLFVRADAPLTSLEVLKRELRLSGVPAEVDADALINQALREARVGFYRRLGASLISIYASGSLVSNPTTDAEYKAYLAELTEIRWVKLLLIDKLPILFEDASGEQGEAWNTEGTFRKDDHQALIRLRLQLHAQVESGLSALAGDQDFDDTAEWKVSSIEPEETPGRSGTSIFNGGGDD
jgi:hypothetical protein